MFEYTNSEGRIIDLLIDLYFVTNYTLHHVTACAFRNRRYFRAVDRR